MELWERKVLWSHPLPFAIRCSQFATRRSQFATRRSQFATRRSQFATRHPAMNSHIMSRFEVIANFIALFAVWYSLLHFYRVAMQQIAGVLLKRRDGLPLLPQLVVAHPAE